MEKEGSLILTCSLLSNSGATSISDLSRLLKSKAESSSSSPYLNSSSGLVFLFTTLFPFLGLERRVFEDLMFVGFFMKLAYITSSKSKL